MAEPSQFRVSTIKLDEATRARIYKELGLQAGLDVVPQEITLVAVDRESAGFQEPETQGYGLGATAFANPTLAPNVTPQVLARSGFMAQRRWVIPTVI
jgi:hypothetical protein